MPFRTTLKTTGGGKLQAVLKKAEETRVKKIKVGIFSESKYQDADQTPVATVALIQEYGLAGNPERPFFRRAISELERDLPGKLADILDPATLDVDAAAADAVGRYAAGVVRDSAKDLKDPPNAANTVKRGKNPLVDTGELVAAVDHEAV